MQAVRGYLSLSRIRQLHLNLHQSPALTRWRPSLRRQSRVRLPFRGYANTRLIAAARPDRLRCTVVVSHLTYAKAAFFQMQLDQALHLSAASTNINVRKAWSAGRTHSAAPMLQSHGHARTFKQPPRLPAGSFVRAGHGVVAPPRPSRPAQALLARVQSEQAIAVAQRPAPQLATSQSSTRFTMNNWLGACAHRVPPFL